MTNTLEDTLIHVGVKGMKWGVRNDVGHEGESAKTKTIAKLDKKYEKSFQGAGGFAKLHNAVAGEMNNRLDALNDRFPDVDMGDPSKKSQNDAYLKAYEKTLEDSLVAASKSFGTNASGTLGVKLTRTGEGQEAWFEAEFQDLKVKHVDELPPRLRITPKLKNGKIIGQEIEFMTTDITHVEDFGVGEFLEHFGVKGMRWGHRSATIKEARANRSKFKEATGAAEKNYKAQTTASGKAAALKELKAREKEQWDNERTAKTLKRGEQLAIALIGGVAAVPVLAVKSHVDRDERKFKSRYDD